MRDLTAGGIGMFDHLDRFAARTAIVTDDGRRLSYTQLLAQADGIAACVGTRSLVLIVTRNEPAAVAAYVGLQRAGCVTMLVNHKMGEGALRALIDAFRPAFVFLPSDLASIISASPLHRVDDYTLSATGIAPDYTMHAELAVLLGTSGSTGSPEYVRLSRSNLAANTRSIVEYLGIAANDRAITTMPMSYSYGLSIINTHLAMGATLVTTELSLMEKPFWTLLREARVTTFGGVPFIYQMLKRLHFERMQLPHLRYITQAGGRLDTELAREFAHWCAEKGVGFIAMYGQTEATARIAYVPAEHAAAKAGTIGIAIPGGRIWLAGENGKPVVNGTPGEIVYEGANVSLGNVRDRFALAEPDRRRGVLFTGDIGSRDRDGFFLIHGRKSRFLKVFGHRVGLDDVEQLLARRGIEAVCAGVDDALVIFTTDAGAIDRIRDIVRDNTSISPKGIKITQIASIPRNDAGKVRYAALNELT